MTCQNCGKKDANTHIKRMIGGRVQELHLCGECAAGLGYQNVFEGTGLHIGDLIGGMFDYGGGHGRELPKTPEQRCPFCGGSFSDFVNIGKAGCSKCYDTFYSRLLPSLQRIHGKTQHGGKIPKNAHVVLQKEIQLSTLKRQLNEAVASQEFEKAAELRDAIRKEEQGGTRHE